MSCASSVADVRVAGARAVVADSVVDEAVVAEDDVVVVERVGRRSRRCSRRSCRCRAPPKISSRPTPVKMRSLPPCSAPCDGTRSTRRARAPGSGSRRARRRAGIVAVVADRPVVDAFSTPVMRPWSPKTTFWPSPASIRSPREAAEDEVVAAVRGDAGRRRPARSRCSRPGAASSRRSCRRRTACGRGRRRRVRLAVARDQVVAVAAEDAVAARRCRGSRRRRRARAATSRCRG